MAFKVTHKIWSDSYGQVHAQVFVNGLQDRDNHAALRGKKAVLIKLAFLFFRSSAKEFKSWRLFFWQPS